MVTLHVKVSPAACPRWWKIPRNRETQFIDSPIFIQLIILFWKRYKVFLTTTLTVNVLVLCNRNNLYDNIAYDNIACERERWYFHMALENSNTAFWLVYLRTWQIDLEGSTQFSFYQVHTKGGRTHAVSWLVATLEILGLGQCETRGCFFCWAQNSECVLIGNLDNELAQSVPPHSFPPSSSDWGWRWWASYVSLWELKEWTSVSVTGTS